MKTEHYEQYRDLEEKGGYAQKQIVCKDRLISWSHTSRFETGYKLVKACAGGTILDYGFGDGTFLALVCDLFDRAVGVDPEKQQVADCSTRFAKIPNLSFCLIDEIDGDEHTGRYDMVVCMEVLEHCVPET